MPRALLSLAMLAALAGGCRPAATGPIVASLITTPEPRPLHAAITGPLRAATDQGLVRLDRDGQIVAGVALRWAIVDNGRDYIFRIDPSGASAETIARRLRTALHRAPDPLKAVLAPIDSVAAVTATVVEIRLSMPQPDLLVLLARPEFGLEMGGPLRIGGRDADAVLLRPTGGDEPLASPVLLRVERVGRAVARFAAGHARFVSGGTFADLPVARAAAWPRGALVFDFATGLFGLVPRPGSAVATDGALRRALSLAIDRDRIVAAIDAPRLVKATTLAGSIIEPSLPERIGMAQGLLAGHAPIPALRIAMPAGPGARLMFALLARDWARIGVAAVVVDAKADADFALIDMVAPTGSLAAIACAAAAGCDPADRLALLDPPYIPIATPVRWSLVDRSLDGFAENALAAHPLDQLRRAD
ncbi:ABC transporter substrate-binding protein [Sphingomonas nostoxanthinifaciens]|uniref:ABC transporter substrate-binding protein n=1 Tax=Sphingomonas nostoxanthinifaciens TaxID=2872652 RepID=UPI001CC219E1|nr:ABC transporter substrate-binding protein [Sphingomonas nostoxanthinifaciens]UAK23322.1 ABC transporter substrate-binding protein [Sphingomonas nostoxanthinifaciens]